MTSKKNLIFVAALFILLILLSSGIYWFFYRKPSTKSLINSQKTEEKNQQETQSVCLTDDEITDYPHIVGPLNYPKFPLTIIIKDKNSNQEKFSFQIENVSENYHPVEVHKCGVYVIREFNYNPKKSKQDPGYREELWHYDYSSKGRSIILLSEKAKEFISYFSPDFRIDPNEKYIVLEKGYLGKEDYSLVIKDLKTKEDAFILSQTTVNKQYPDIRGTFGLKNWSNDDKYFWTDIFVGGYTRAFIRIEMDTWQYEVFPMSVMGGEALNPNTGYLSTHGYRELPQGGVEAFLSLYNLLTKKAIPITSAIIPSESIGDWGPPYFFQPRWLSDTELQYKLPTGGKKIYKINE